MAPPEEDKAAERIRDAGQQIWQAGLGAFARIQREGGKAFESLVKDGADVRQKTKRAAEETMAQAQTRMAGLASELGGKAAGGWNRLERLFEDRVAGAIDQLEVPSAEEFEALRTRVDALEDELEALRARLPARPATRRRAASSSAPPPHGGDDEDGNDPD
jgi:poly(hydroxyalkanoate) granule-associated protein